MMIKIISIINRNADIIPHNTMPKNRLKAKPMKKVENSSLRIIDIICIEPFNTIVTEETNKKIPIDIKSNENIVIAVSIIAPPYFFMGSSLMNLPIAGEK